MKHVTTKDMLEEEPDDDSSVETEVSLQTNPSGPWSPAHAHKMQDRKRRGKALPDELPEALKELTIRSLRKLDKVIKLPIDAENGALLRSIVTSCGIAISSQLRADEQQLRQKAHGDALQRLLKIIEQERALLARSEPVSAKDADGAGLTEIAGLLPVKIDDK